MEDLTKKFLEACTKTDLWRSDQEESSRYSKYPMHEGFDKFRWHALNFMSKWEFKPRVEFRIVKKSKEE